MKLPKQGSHIIMMAVLRHFKKVYLHYSFHQKLDRILCYKQKIIFQKESRKIPTCRIKHGEKNWHMMKDSHMKVSWQNRTRTCTHYPHFFLSNFSIFPFFIKHRRFIVIICFSFSIINSNLLELQDFYDLSISQHLLNSVYVRNTGESSVCFFPRLFCRIFLNFWFYFYTVTNSDIPEKLDSGR